MNRLSLQDRARVLGCLVEGNSMRATSRLCDVSLNTVTKLLVDVGTACDIYQNDTLRNLNCKVVQVDEIWSFIGMKAKNVPPMREHEANAVGDFYTRVAIDADSKLVLSWAVGRRSADVATEFMKDVAGRLANRVQLSTDGFHAYLKAVHNAFDGEVDYGMLQKMYAPSKETERRYSPNECISAFRKEISGDPDRDKISTSFVVRQNLTMRMSMRRFTRLTNGFSKKVQNHACAIGLHYMYYNFGRIHKTLRVTPAMQAKITDRIWSLEEIANLAN